MSPIKYFDVNTIPFFVYKGEKIRKKKKDTSAAIGGVQEVAERYVLELLGGW